MHYSADQAILTTVACWLYNRPFQPDDYLVTGAMHINTKKIPQWAPQSLWWHDEPDKGRFAENRPDIPKEKTPGPWRHYLMTTAYGIPTDTGDLPVSFNPYIELAAAHPINTNCRNCHQRAFGRRAAIGTWVRNTVQATWPNRAPDRWRI